MKLLVALSIGTAVIASPVVAKPAKTSAATSEDARFTAFGERIVDANLKLDPVGATQAGDHRYDALMPDASAAGRAARDALAKRSLAELAKFNRSKLSREHQVDAILLKDQLDYLLFSDERLQDWAWDPLTYNGTVGGALFPLGTRNFAPLPVRLRSATARLNALPTYLQQARQSLVPARVPRIHEVHPERPRDLGRRRPTDWPHPTPLSAITARCGAVLTFRWPLPSCSAKATSRRNTG